MKIWKIEKLRGKNRFIKLLLIAGVEVMREDKILFIYELIKQLGKSVVA